MRGLVKEIGKILVFTLSILFFFSVSLYAECDGWIFQDWSSFGGSEIEFGITSEDNGSIVDDPWVFESGYNGAWGFDGEQ